MATTLVDPATISISGPGGEGNGAGAGGTLGTPPAQPAAIEDSRETWRQAVNAQLSAETAEATPPPATSPVTPPATPPAATPAAPAAATPPATPPVTPETPQAAAAAAAAATLRAQIQTQYGLDLTGLQSDEQILPFLIQQVQHGQQIAGKAQQLQQLASYGQLFLQHQNDFNRFLAAQQQGQPTPAQPTAPAGPFALPDWNPAHEQFLARDDKGNLVEKPGAPPGTLARYYTYQNARQELADKLLTNPQDLLGPWMERVATQKAQELVQANMGQYQDQVNATNFVAQNSSWLHSRDVAGNVLVDPFSGMPKLSPYGERFKHYVVQLSEAGVTDMRILQNVALQQLKADIAQAQLAQATAPAQQQAANQNLLATANRMPSQSGNLVPTPGTGTTGVQPVVEDQNASFASMFRAALKAEGVKDTDIMPAPEAA